MPLSRRSLLALSAAAIAAPTGATPAGAQAVTPMAGQGWWVFDPPADSFDPASRLDLRYLNEATAGDHGFIRAAPDGESFVRGDGEAIRFWGGTTAADGERALIDRHARFLAKRGVNMARWHGNLAPTDRNESLLTDVNETSLDQVFYVVAAMKKQGIYTTISPYWAFFEHLHDGKGARRFPNWPIPRDTRADTTAALLFFDPVMIAAYNGWITALFTRTNPYTGIALKDDPAVAIFQIQNEDSLLFWTLNGLAGADRALLEHQFGDWLSARYGAPQTDSSLPNLYDLTQPEPADSDRARRLADVTEFLTQTMRRFNADIIAFLRNDLGVKCLINAGNWRTADTTRLNDAERYSYTPGDALAVNRYVTGRHDGGDTSGWAVKTGDRFTDVSTLTEIDKFPLAIKQVAGHTMLVTESLWVAPTGFESEGPFLISALQSLNGVNGYYWFSLGSAGRWEQPHSANGYLPSISKWSANSPMILGQFPAAALMYRLGYVAPNTTPVVTEHRSPDDLWHRRVPLIAEESGFDPNRDAQPPTAADHSEHTLSPLAFLIGPVRISYDDGTDTVADLSAHIDAGKTTITDLSGALMWNYGDGIATLDTPRAQGVTGFLSKHGVFHLNDCAIISTNTYAAILVVSLDGLPLRVSHKILVQIGTQARPTGWSDRPATWTADGESVSGREIVDHGRAPWLITDSHIQIRLTNPVLAQATALDGNGMVAGSAKSHRDGQMLVIDPPADCLYIILEA